MCCIWSYLVPDNPVCIRNMLLAVMLHHRKQKAACFPEMALFVNISKHIRAAHTGKNPVTLQKLRAPVIFSRKNVWTRKHQRCGRYIYINKVLTVILCPVPPPHTHTTHISCHFQFNLLIVKFIWQKEHFQPYSHFSWFLMHCVYTVRGVSKKTPFDFKRPSFIYIVPNHKSSNLKVLYTVR